MSSQKNAARRGKRHAITASLTAEEHAVVVARCAASGLTKTEIVRAGLRLGDAPRDRALLRVTGEVMRICAMLRSRHGDDDMFTGMRELLALESHVAELVKLATAERMR